ncbi:hypothetical protein CLV98_109125 [Dyadobacter jejuensis]|uniref:Uncharacterized protein n=1 Tax=Dyadobacter jejuensis TaxID=1082580 RepID=A0A316AGT6_9BACT|nr:hypothetical protein [Dyadobacter jejuensis]PWJ57016.1 hypothetical protein CLV98_109125 [Dyadobacter jejuensis]
METTEQKRRRLFGKQDVPLYLAELNKILKIHIGPTDLLSIVETDEIRQQNLAKNLIFSTKILFDEKNKLKEIIKINEVLGVGYYVFTKYSRDCGTLLMNSFDNFDFDFPFDALLSGLITFTQEDLRKEIVLDFYEEDGVEYLEIEIYEK